jgi:DNA excision repair protein ERCC-5
VSEDVNEGLSKFKKWLDGNDLGGILGINASQTKGNTKEEIFYRKHNTARNRWNAPAHFPDRRVLTAYQNPVVDTSNGKFSWGIPDPDGLLVFCNKHIGWSPQETSALLKPVIKKLESGSMHQTRIDSFLRYEDNIKFADIRSKRLREVLSNLQKSEPDNALEEKSPKKRKFIDPVIIYKPKASSKSQFAKSVPVPMSASMPAPKSKPKPAPKKKYSLKATLTAIQTTESLMNRDYTHPTAKESQYKKAVSPQKLPPPPAYQKYSEVVTTSKEDEKSDNISTIPSLPERNEKYYKH